MKNQEIPLSKILQLDHRPESFYLTNSLKKIDHTKFYRTFISNNGKNLPANSKLLSLSQSNSRQNNSQSSPKSKNFDYANYIIQTNKKLKLAKERQKGKKIIPTLIPPVADRMQRELEKDRQIKIRHLLTQLPKENSTNNLDSNLCYLLLEILEAVAQPNSAYSEEMTLILKLLRKFLICEDPPILEKSNQLLLSPENSLKPLTYRELYMKFFQTRNLSNNLTENTVIEKFSLTNQCNEKKEELQIQTKGCDNCQDLKEDIEKIKRFISETKEMKDSCASFLSETMNSKLAIVESKQEIMTLKEINQKLLKENDELKKILHDLVGVSLRKTNKKVESKLFDLDYFQKDFQKNKI